MDEYNSYFNIRQVDEFLTKLKSGDWLETPAETIKVIADVYFKTTNGKGIFSVIQNIYKQKHISVLDNVILSSMLNTIINDEPIMYSDYVNIYEYSKKTSKMKMTVTLPNEYRLLSDAKEFTYFLNLLGVNEFSHMVILLDKINYTR